MRRTLPVSFVMHAALAEASELRHREVGRAHLFIALCSLQKFARSYADAQSLPRADRDTLERENRIVKELFRTSGLDATLLRRRVRQYLKPGSVSPLGHDLKLSRATDAVVARAEAMASPLAVSTVHLLAALLTHPGSEVRRTLSDFSVSRRNLYKSARKSLLLDVGKDGEPDVSEPIREPDSDNRSRGDEDRSIRGTALDRYTTDLTRAAREGRFEPLSSRRDVLLSVIQTLARTSKNNPLLVGPPGVGKTAIVEGLALRIAADKDRALAGKRILSLNTGLLVGGTGSRGDLESRITAILQECEVMDDVILFVDEIHALLREREIADLLKPALSRGRIACIGATTIDEFRKYIEKDPAMERRFQKVDVPEPAREEALQIVAGVAERLSRHHQVDIPEDAVRTAVDLSITFDREHFLPDKAIDLLDKAAASCVVPQLSLAPHSIIGADLPRPMLTPLTIASVLSEKLGVPVDLLSAELGAEYHNRLSGLRTFLRQRVKGQDMAIDRVCGRLGLSQIDLHGRKGPVAVFLFTGPSGVGKTELAKSLAAFLFGDEGRLIRLDMSEFKEEHSISKLIGSPPGYVGHDQEGQLTRRLRTSPYSVVLLDEVEKGHPRVFDLFLQVFDEGRLMDSRGRAADARHAVFIMTSNLHRDQVNEWFRPELLNRVDDVVRFEPLSRDAACTIVGDLLGEIAEGLRSRYSVELRLGDACLDFLVDRGYSDLHGARGIRRVVEEHVTARISGRLLERDMRSGETWTLAVSGDVLVLERWDRPQWSSI